MDLETMRMKVDSQMYPSLRHFLRDIEQIAFNAKEYNPATLKDQRGRSIVHASNSMVDIIESHAYNFKKEIGYDLFRRCEEACQRRGIPDPLPIVAGGIMPEEHKKFYYEILNIHKEFKTQEGQNCENEDNDNNEITIERSTRSSRNSGENVTFVDLDSLPDCRKKKTKSIESNTFVESRKENVKLEGNNNESGEMVDIEMKKELETRDELDTQDTNQESKVEEISQLPPINIDDLPIMVLLRDSINRANTVDTRNALDLLQSKFVKDTQAFNIYDLVAIMTQLNRLSREFIRHGDWNLLINNIKQFSTIFQSRVSFQ